jgi:hypothetical protein
MGGIIYNNKYKNLFVNKVKYPFIPSAYENNNLSNMISADVINEYNKYNIQLTNNDLSKDVEDIENNINANLISLQHTNIVTNNNEELEPTIKFDDDLLTSSKFDKIVLNSIENDKEINVIINEEINVIVNNETTNNEINYNEIINNEVNEVNYNEINNETNNETNNELNEINYNEINNKTENEVTEVNYSEINNDRDTYNEVNEITNKKSINYEENYNENNEVDNETTFDIYNKEYYENNKKEKLTSEDDNTEQVVSNNVDEMFKDYLGNINIKTKYKNCDYKYLIDGDEESAYLNLNRNEPTRVLHGMNNQFNNLCRYLKDEIDEYDRNGNWWGLHEY